MSAASVRGGRSAPAGPLAQLLAALALALALAGCATPQLHDEGLLLIESGQIEAGLAKLAEASRAEPGNLRYRAVLLRSREQALGRLLAAAGSERAAERLDVAREILERVLRIDPGNGRAQLGLEAIAMDRRHAEALARARSLLSRNDLAGAADLVQPVLDENPRHGAASLLQRALNERLAAELAAPPSLKAPLKKPVTLQFRDANIKLVFEALSRVSGINVLLDRDIRPDLKTSIFVKDASVEDAIDLLLLQNQLEKKIVGDSTVFVYPGTQAKLREYQELKVKSFHLINADPKQMLAMLKTLLKTRDVFIHERTNTLIMRDTPEAIALAEKMVSDQDVADPEVMLEVEVLEVTRSRLSELGIRYPDSLSLSTPGGGGAPLTLDQLRALSSGDLLVSPLGVTLNLRLQDGSTNVLASPRIRARNREKARILIGDRVPVITNSVTPVATGTPVVTGSVQYLDVGIKLEVEPTVHGSNEVGIRVGLEVSSIVREISTPSGTLAYQVGSRTASTALRLKDGETQVLAGLINDDERRTANKIPGLGDLPVIGRLFGSHGRNVAKTEIILSITPRIVGLPRLPDAREIEYWTGTESGLRTAPLAVRTRGRVTLSSTSPPGTGTPSPAAAPSAPPVAAPGPAVPAAPAPTAPPADPAAPRTPPSSYQAPASPPPPTLSIPVTPPYTPTFPAPTPAPAPAPAADAVPPAPEPPMPGTEPPPAAPAQDLSRPPAIRRPRRVPPARAPRPAGMPERARARRGPPASRPRGFTLIELLVTVAIVGLLASVALPLAELNVQRERERELRLALRQIRGALDAYKQAADEGRVAREAGGSGYPPSLEVLADGVPDQRSPDRDARIRFLRRVPRDPMDRDAGKSAAQTWGKRSYDSDARRPQEGDDVFDVYSLSPGTGLNGTPYREW